MGSVVIVAIDGSRDDDLERRLAALHSADLYRRRMGPQQHAVGDKKSVLHIPSWMILGNIEGLKVVVIILDVRTTGDLESHAPKDIDDLVHHQR